MSPELRAQLLRFLPASVVDAPDAYPPGYDGPLDERTPGFFRIPNISRDRDRLIDEHSEGRA
jgi:hypothetical protein